MVREVGEMAIVGDQINDDRCLVIAEAGVNHNGDIRLAIKLAEAAKAAGADVVKYQVFNAETLVSPTGAKAPYQHRARGSSQFDMLRELELTAREFTDLKQFCDEIDIEFMATPYDASAVALLQDLGVRRYKVASADIVNRRLLACVADSRKPIILSAGMASLFEVQRAVDFVRERQVESITVLQCTTEYPTPAVNANVRRMAVLSKSTGCPTGFSDHTVGFAAAAAAVALGATCIEKHLTLSRDMIGPDHFASAEPIEFGELVHLIRDIEACLGTGEESELEEEGRNRRVMRRSIHAARDLEQGRPLAEADLSLERPNDGIEAWYEPDVLGRQLARKMSAHEPISDDDLV